MTSYDPSVTGPRSQDFFDNIPPLPPKPFTDPSRLAPEDAFLPQSASHLPGDYRTFTRPINSINGNVDTPSSLASARERRDKDRGRSGSRRRKGVGRKILWVKKPKYPDNYTDAPTFLSHLQRNQGLQPYNFWTLVADSTVIVQHLSSVAIFVCGFVGIYQEQVSPKSVISLGSTGTLLGWILYDFWIGQVKAATAGSKTTAQLDSDAHPQGLDGQVDQSLSRGHSRPPSRGRQPSGLGLTLSNEANDYRSRGESIEPAPSVMSDQSFHSPSAGGLDTSPAIVPRHNPFDGVLSQFSQRNQQRLATVKSAILIVTTLYVLSPILKSLTQSTSKDSIWAISATLMGVNILFFDYSAGIDDKFPAPISTNAAVMSSTVLASRLLSPTHVFSLMLFAIQVFGLFPVFRRHLRHHSGQGDFMLTAALVLVAGGSLGVTLSQNRSWQAVLIGMILWSAGTALGMGSCSWWLIGLQRYKNVVIGPWDPARPVIRRDGWD